LTEHPWQWPVEDYLADPFPFWHMCRHDFPIWQHPDTKVFHLTRYHDVVGVFSDPDTYSNTVYERSLGVVFGPTMLQMDGHAHVVRRTIIAPEVVGKRLAGYVELIRSNVAALLDPIAATGSDRFDLVADFSTWLPVNVICDMLGLPKEQMGFYHDCYRRMMDGLSSWRPEAQREGVAASRAFAESVAPIVAERREQPGDDFISRVLHANVDGEHLSDAEVQAFLALLLTAGGETTDKAIANLWLNLLSHPDQLAEVRNDRELLDAAFSEMMRHSFPVISQVRTVMRDVEHHGVTVPAGATVQISIGSANHDETVFAEPGRFDIHRGDLWLAKELRKGSADGPRFGHLGFGLGKHFCLGYEMARAEAVIGSEALLDRFAVLSLADDAVPHQRITQTTRSVASLPVRAG
jgi:cytochrome P450